MKAAASDGDDTRMSRVTATVPGAEVGDEGPAELRGTWPRSPRRVESADVVGLEDLGVDGRHASVTLCVKSVRASVLSPRMAPGPTSALRPDVAAAADDRGRRRRRPGRSGCWARRWRRSTLRALLDQHRAAEHSVRADARAGLDDAPASRKHGPSSTAPSSTLRVRRHHGLRRQRCRNGSDRAAARRRCRGAPARTSPACRCRSSSRARRRRRTSRHARSATGSSRARSSRACPSGCGRRSPARARRCRR